MTFNSLSPLVGKTVSEVRLSEGEHQMLMVCSDGTRLLFDTDADCCSETWIADIIGTHFLVGHVITAAEGLELPDNLPDSDERTRQEYDQYFGIKITTVVGYCDIIFRNSSNGYYGGSWDLFVNGEKHSEYKSQYDRNWKAFDASDWQVVTGDFQA